MTNDYLFITPPRRLTTIGINNKEKKNRGKRTVVHANTSARRGQRRDRNRSGPHGQYVIGVFARISTSHKVSRGSGHFAGRHRNGRCPVRLRTRRIPRSWLSGRREAAVRTGV